METDGGGADAEGRARAGHRRRGVSRRLSLSGAGGDAARAAPPPRPRHRGGRRAGRRWRRARAGGGAGGGGGAAAACSSSLGWPAPRGLVRLSPTGAARRRGGAARARRDRGAGRQRHADQARAPSPPPPHPRRPRRGGGGGGRVRIWLATAEGVSHIEISVGHAAVELAELLLRAPTLNLPASALTAVLPGSAPPAAVRALELARKAEGLFRGEAIAHGLRSTEKWACLEPAVRADAAAAAGGDGLDRLNNIYLRPLHGLLRAKLLLAVCMQAAPAAAQAQVAAGQPDQGRRGARRRGGGGGDGDAQRGARAPSPTCCSRGRRWSRASTASSAVPPPLQQTLLTRRREW